MCVCVCACVCVCVCIHQGEDLEQMFQGAGPLAFDLNYSDNENMAIAQTKAQKVCVYVCLCWRSCVSVL